MTLYVGIPDMLIDKVLAWKLSGAGGSGYLILISKEEVSNAIKVNIRIKENLI
jgi:galactokinase/mevalonate kinase-like predicted kinase